MFGKIWSDEKWLAVNWNGNRRFLKDEQGLLFFLDSNYQPRLCVPKKRKNFILREVHENPLKSTHVSAE